MQFINNLFSLRALFILAPLTLAAPTAAPSTALVEVVALNTNITVDDFAAQSNYAYVFLISGLNCAGGSEGYQVTGGSHCFPVTAVRRSIQLISEGCNVRTWSGTNCQGSSTGIGNGCTNIPYGSASVSC